MFLEALPVLGHAHAHRGAQSGHRHPEIDGPGAALEAVDAIATDLDEYHLMHAARGTMLRRLGQRDAARAAFERAAQLAATEADRGFLSQQIEELAE